MDWRCQLVGGVDGGTVLQDELEAGSAPAAAGIEERCGAICWHCHCLENDVCEEMHPKERSVPHLFIHACDTNIHKCSNRANTRDNQQLKASLHADFSSDLSPVKSKLFSNNTRCGLKRVKTKICVKAGESEFANELSSFWTAQFQASCSEIYRKVSTMLKPIKSSNWGADFFSCKLIGLPKELH